MEILNKKYTKTYTIYRKYDEKDIDQLFLSARQILKQGVVTKLTIDVMMWNGIDKYKTAALYLSLNCGTLSASCHDGYRDKSPMPINLDQVRTRFCLGLYREPRK